MNRCLFLFVFLLLLFVACKDKVREGDAEGAPFPVVSYLQSQVRHVDTSLYSIVKISKAHGRRDTAYLRREQFKAAAQDFLSLPDISSEKLRGKYAETRLYDEDLKKVVITYVPKKPDDFETVTRQDVLIEPGDAAGDQVQTIYVETLSDGGDSTVQKKLTWNVNRSFQIIKLINKPGLPETVETTNVTWSGGR